ncbi:hypothetical protein SEA_LILYLOU_21 [Microbacterium phage LilyLou]|uniref:Uncharacterized protein n=2 Tax=Tinytimothyvirus alex44 TaxID=2845588 RepID=A0A4Y6EL99_9CAUD|nr:hypothetical protein SEA_ARMAWEN_20 [Microbacterium phage ArMaWen]QDF16049.1 hypothetical protein SEA_LILYLOU_21 [Microbacterium phage LilyLou]
MSSNQEFFSKEMIDAVTQRLRTAAWPAVQTEIVEENDAEERTLLGINLEYVCPACGEQVVIYNLTKERVVAELETILFATTQPSLDCQLEWIKFALVAVLDQDQVTVHETVIIKEIES